MKHELYEAHYNLGNKHWWYTGKKRIVHDLLERDCRGKKNLSIVDFGCGCGLMLEELNQYGDVTAMDISEDALSYCGKISSKARLYQNNLEEYNELLSEKFDYGVFLDVVEHIKYDETALCNICSYLKRGGGCIITTSAYQWMWSKHDENNMHYRRYSKKELYGKLKKAGFKVEYISYYNTFLFPPAAVVRLASKFFSIDNNSEAETALPNKLINAILYKVFSSERFWIRKKKHFPFGVSLIAIVKK